MSSACCGIPNGCRPFCDEGHPYGGDRVVGPILIFHIPSHIPSHIPTISPTSPPKRSDGCCSGLRHQITIVGDRGVTIFGDCDDPRCTIVQIMDMLAFL